MTTGRINQVPTVVGSLHTHTMNVCAIMLIPFSVRCLLAWLSWFGAAAARWPVPPQASQPAQPATHTPMYSRLFVCCCFTYIYYICSTSHRQTDRQTSIDRSISVYSLSLSLSLSLSIHSLGSCCLHTLTPPPHDSRRARVCVCVHLAPFRAMLQTSR